MGNKELIILPQYIKFMFIFFFTVDPSLAIVASKGITPYSILWVIMNPFYTTQYLYKFYLLGIDTLFAHHYYRDNFFFLNNRRWLYIAWQLTSIHWFTGFYQNVSITWIVFPLVPLLLKLPIGWSTNPFDLSNPHVQCAISCGARITISPIITYSLILLWSFLPLYLMVKDRRRRKKEAQISGDAQSLGR